jgi:hypothetical protein
VKAHDTPGRQDCYSVRALGRDTLGARVTKHPCFSVTTKRWQLHVHHSESRCGTTGPPCAFIVLLVAAEHPHRDSEHWARVSRGNVADYTWARSNAALQKPACTSRRPRVLHGSRRQLTRYRSHGFSTDGCSRVALPNPTQMPPRTSSASIAQLLLFDYARETEFLLHSMSKVIEVQQYMNQPSNLRRLLWPTKVNRR